MALLSDLSRGSAAELGAQLRAEKRPGDLAVVSIHWGSNWGYEIPRSQVRFARRLVDAGADVVHGHSSHHPRPIEVYRGRLVLYGCGDLANDYEGIGGKDEFRDDLRLAYLASLEPGTGELRELRMVPMQSRRMRLERASAADAEWLCRTLGRAGHRFGTRFQTDPTGGLLLRDI